MKCRRQRTKSSKENSIVSSQEEGEDDAAPSPPCSSSPTAATAPLLWLLHVSRLLPLDDACLECPAAVAFAVAEEARFLVGRKKEHAGGAGGDSEDFFDPKSFTTSSSLSSSSSSSPRFFTSIASYLVAAAHAPASGPAGPWRVVVVEGKTEAKEMTTTRMLSFLFRTKAACS
jgi:hypothetical protein